MSIEILDVQPTFESMVSSPVECGGATEDGCMALAEAAASEAMIAESSNEDPNFPVLATAVVLDRAEDNHASPTLLKATKTALDAMDISYFVHPQNDGATAITFNANVSFARGVPFKILIKESAELFILMLNLPTLVPEERRTLVSKYWTRVNFNLSVGNFEMDFRDGEVRFRVATVVKNSRLSPEMVTVAVETAVSTTRQHLPGQFYVIYGDMDVEKAYHTAGNYQ